MILLILQESSRLSHVWSFGWFMMFFGAGATEWIDLADVVLETRHIDVVKLLMDSAAEVNLATQRQKVTSAMSSES